MLDGKLTIWTIMDRPTDFPDKIVVVLDYVKPGSVVRDPGRWFARDLDHAREIIRTNDPSACVRLDRQPEDEPQIVESWL